MNKIFKNKMFIILIFSPLFVLCLNSNVFAVDFNYNNQKVTLSDYIKSFKYYCVVEYVDTSSSNTTCYRVLATNSRDIAFKKSYTASSFLVSYNVGLDYQSGGVIYYSDPCKLSSLSSFTSSSLKNTSNGYGIAFDCKIIYSNSNIYGMGLNSKGFECINYDNVVFQVAPLTQVEPLTEIIQVEEIQPVMAKIVGIVLPICLTIFGTLLVLYLIKSKNLLQL